MIHRHSSAWLSVLALASLSLVAASGCAVAPSPGAPTSPAATVLPADARAFAYGATVEQVLQNPDLGPRIRGLFWAGWTGATAGGAARLQPGADVYFEQREPVRMICIENTDYIAVSRCVPHDCTPRNVLVLIEQDGAHLYGRLDEGGFVHYYSYGP